jgi:PAS domain-containing protein
MERKYSEELRRLISKSQAIEKELRESRGRLELAIKGADASLWEWHILTDSLTCDDRFSEILGYAPGEILPQRNTWAALIHPEDEPTFVQKGKREKEKGSSLVLNHVLRHTGCHSAQK